MVADRGRALVALNDYDFPGAPPDNFVEFFLSDIFATEPSVEPPA